MRVDLDPETRAALELDGLLALVASHAVTPIGAERILGLAPSASADEIETELGKVEEAGRHLVEVGRLVSGGLPDPAKAMAVLPVEGARTEPAAVRDLAIVLLGASDLRARLLDLDADHAPLLRAMGAATPDLRAEARPVVRGVLPDGRLADEASAELARIRGTVAKVGERLRRMLESLLRDPGSGDVIRDDFITQRNGRYVVPVRSDAHRAVAGIVHAASSSGATLFVEPLETVELNNELVRLAEAEQEEQERIVSGWIDRFRAKAHEVGAAVAAVAEADSIQSRALFAEAAGAVLPVVRPGGALRLVNVRHPVLDRRLRERGERAVPARVEMAPGDRVLVLSGPNTGGKTVALKTIGLAALMAQSGIPICAQEAELPLFRQVRADIGDHQSIEADLSTFSAHVQAIGRFLRDARPPVLFLLDEIGTGTDPAEGAALARAILESVLRPGHTTVATTHQGSLKAWAFTTEGAVSAALEFDAERLRPTYRILMGAAGASAGVDVAARLGLDEAIVARARAYLGGAGERAEAYMERLRERTAEAERLAVAATEREAELVAERERVRTRAAAEADRRRQDAERALAGALRELREDGRREIAAIQDATERARASRAHTRAQTRLTTEAVRRAAEIVASESGAPRPDASPLTEVAPGGRVLVYSLGKEGEIVAVRGERIDVRLGTAVFAVSRSDLRAVPAAAPARPRAPLPKAHESSKPAADDLGGGAREIILIGKTVEEGLEALDKFLDDASLAGWTEVRVVHGHGTGRLRTAVRRFLKSHALVESHRSGEPYEGGDGATIARLGGSG